MRFDTMAEQMASQLPLGLRVVVIGSTSFWHPDSKATCVLIGKRLAAIPELVLVTGGVEGVGETIGRSFFCERERLQFPANVFHLLPVDRWRWDYGETHFAGNDMEERREVLARLTKTYLVVEGGPGTEHEGTVARSYGAQMVPVGRSGGYAGELYSSLDRPQGVSELDWQVLGNSKASPEQVCEVVERIVRTLVVV